MTWRLWRGSSSVGEPSQRKSHIGVVCPSVRVCALSGLWLWLWWFKQARGGRCGGGVFQTDIIATTQRQLKAVAGSAHRDNTDHDITSSIFADSAHYFVGNRHARSFCTWQRVNEERMTFPSELHTHTHTHKGFLRTRKHFL